MDISQDGDQYSRMNKDQSFKIDEGFVDETRSLDDADSAMGLEPRITDSARVLGDTLEGLQQAVMNLSESQRSAHAYHVLQTLRNSSITAIVEMLRPRLHMDPILYLPPELTSFIFAYLPPDSLLEASRVSKAWRERTLDSSLWKQKFIAEGWKLDTSEVMKFEQDLTSRRSKGKKVRKTDETDLEHNPKKRHTIHHEDTTGSSSSQSQDTEMTGIDLMSFTTTSPSITSSLQVEGTPVEFRGGSHDMEVDRVPDAMVVSAARSDVRLNYNHVYRQRRRLEENWSAGKYKSFQLPHKDHPEEAHAECVYTIQYQGKYLVSGSRDRTLRIWDLDTQRLIRRPLSGHSGSVLCLQFDASPDEDIVVSGSSDTDVIIWQFSTGRLLRRISSAHSESVLNIKFDKRYLVTCSKDKLIKVWNRQSLRPGDDAYPIRGVGGGARFPPYILDLNAIQNPQDMEQYFSTEQLAPLPEYSLIMIINLHAAAVNAVHIHKNELVSASGDRDIKVFNIRTGAQTALCKGHNKGIACVQYDGIRIVSGSSDDTIRIFDPKSQAEVACLKGHSKLVRTVQASFGDQPGDEEDLENQARKIDREWLEAKLKGELPSGRHDWRRRRDRNAGSSRPEDVMAIGAHLPPGGGGSPWARIVSGSYDQTVIIWRKAKDGRWVPHHTLKQTEALTAAGEPLLTRSERLFMATRGQGVAPVLGAAAAQPPATQQGTPGNLQQAQQQQQQQQQQIQMQFQARMQQQSRQLAQLQAFQGAAPPILPPIAGALGQNNPWQAPQYVQPIIPPANQVQPIQQPANNPRQQHHHAMNPGQNGRVFKLQFDARRIVACAQDPKIVGWDFANGDEEIIQCSRFFAQPN